LSSESFSLIDGDSDSNIIIHIPHSSRLIPESVRRELLLSEVELEAELNEVTDTKTDELAFQALELIAEKIPTPTLFINRLSRFVIDPERFPDEREVMNRVGMGAVYRKTTSGAQLRPENFDDRELLKSYFHPYAEALAFAVGATLARCGSVVIIDLHSYRANQHPNAINQGQRRPGMCIGTDPFHSPSWLVEIFREEFGAIGDWFENEPYAGTYVPLPFYLQEPKVASIMMETRADTFLDGALQKSEGFERVSQALANTLIGIHAHSVGGKAVKGAFRPVDNL
jgi:N-formylglutamate amidohydrolase